MADQKTILCCEDDHRLCDMMVAKIATAGYKTLAAYSGQEAIQILKRESIDLIITDMRMSQGNGLYLVSNSKRVVREKPPIIVVTGFSDVPEQQLFDLGVEAVLEKPIDFKELFEIMERAIARKERRAAS